MYKKSFARRTNRKSSFASAIGAGARTALRLRRARSYTKTSTSQSRQSEPLTGQSDYKTDYRKRRLSPRQRKSVAKKVRWKRKVVRAVRDANTGSTHVVRRSLFQNLSSLGVSNAVVYGLYGLNGTSNDTFNSTADIRELYRKINNANFTSINQPGSAVQTQNDKIYSLHATMEMTLNNEGTNDAIVEAYYIRGRKATPKLTDPVGIYADGFSKAAVASAPNYPSNLFDYQLLFSTIGVTPFQCPWFTQHFTIYKRQKFRIVPGQEVNMVITSGPATFNASQVEMASTDRRYHGIIFQHQGSPSFVTPSTSAKPTAVTFLSVRRYRLKMMRDDLPKTALDPSG